MLKCDEQTYKDLEFEKIQTLLESYCIGETSARIVKNLKPVRETDELVKFLNQTSELTSIYRESERFPRLEFEELTTEIQRLPIRDISLPAKSFANIRLASIMVNSLLYFFDKREKEFPELFSLFAHVEYTTEIIELIDTVFDQHNQVKDSASKRLEEIRQDMVTAKRRVNSTFDKIVRKLLKRGVLSDTKESFYNERRVLAVLSSYKREIPGRIVGNSKTGNVTFIEPGEVIPLNDEYEQLQDDERQEIILILKELTKKLSVYLPLIIGYQQVLTKLDFIHAKSKLALLLDANLPAINAEKSFDLVDCYHPLLKLNNKKQNKSTIPQRILMNQQARILVISGPNAGGKSITLKTVGLLQLMLQCGLLVPVHPNSKMCFFDSLLTDIGDNQSIDNELSTYSYRLKRMRHFLHVSNENSLLLLDEFGTGSDPELGGALAEVFFETLYEKGVFGVITTHYNNIKLKADELPEAINGCMLFDTETLHPLFKLSIGQPGSSFTFEVAQTNGIPKKLINRAKSKLDSKRVKMDKLLHELQKKESYLKRLADAHVEAQQIAEEHRIHHEKSRERYEEKLEKLNRNAEETSKMVTLGKKLQQFIDNYKLGSKKKDVNKELLEEIQKYVAKEKSKIEEAKQEERLKKIVKQKQKAKKNSPKKDEHQQERIKLGSQVRLIATRQVGEVEEIVKDEVTVLFGFAKMKVKLGQLQWVKG